jgi:hypothetical protein
MSTGQFFRNLTYEFETLRWWLYMRSTVTGPGILGRGVWKFAMAYIRDYDDLIWSFMLSQMTALSGRSSPSTTQTSGVSALTTTM